MLKNVIFKLREIDEHDKCNVLFIIIIVIIEISLNNKV